jgi:hypothetical protein
MGAMREKASDLGWKAVALVVLLIAAWILLKIVIGFLSWVFTIAIAIAAVIAVIWALNRLF